MIRHQDSAIAKVQRDDPTRILLQQSCYALISADPNDCWTPPVGHGGDEDAKELLGHGHPGVEPVPVDPVQRYAEELSAVHNEAGDGEIDAECDDAQGLHTTAMLRGAEGVRVAVLDTAVLHVRRYRRRLRCRLSLLESVHVESWVEGGTCL